MTAAASTLSAKTSLWAHMAPSIPVPLGPTHASQLQTALAPFPEPAKSRDGMEQDSNRESIQEPTRDSAREEDDAWVARAQQGDSAAFDRLVLKHSPKLYGLVYHMTSNHEDTNDLLQDIWAKAYRSLGGFRGRSSFPTWMHSIAVNMTINHLKKRGRRFQMSLDDVDSQIQNDQEFLELTASSTPVRETDLKELQVRLNEAMQKLTPDHRAVVTMFDIQGMPHADIARVLGVSEGTVRSRLFYAHRQLQNFLSEFHQS
ncbi:MAG: hypothetical protein RLZZ253_944 [Verrucomicrobiota bacterium]